MEVQPNLADYFKWRCIKGLKARGFGDNPQYIERLNYEVELITRLEFCGYLLLVADYVRWAREQKIPVGPGRGCFLPKTQIKTSSGFSAIEDIEPGQKVFSHDGTLNTVLARLKYDISEEVLDLELENGSVVSCTSDHKFLTRNRGFVRAEDLTEKDDIVMV